MKLEASLVLHAVEMIASIAIFLQSLEVLIAIHKKSADRAVPMTAVAEILSNASILPASLWRALVSDRSMMLMQAIRIALSIFAFRYGLGTEGWVLQLILAVATLLRFLGAFNGGSDAMTVVVLTGLIAGSVRPEAGLLWISGQSILSYFLSGFRKALNPRWWSGEALRGFLVASPVSSGLLNRRIGESGWFLRGISPVLVLFQLWMPLVLVPGLVRGGLVLAAVFHLFNVICFGLNRFFWIWIATFPALVWWASNYGRLLLRQ